MKLALPRISKSDVLEYDGEHLRFEREWEDGTLLMTRLASDRPFLIDGEVPTAKWLLQEFGKRLTIVPDRVTAVHDWANHEQDECSSRYREARRVQFVLTELDNPQLAGRCAEPVVLAPLDVTNPTDVNLLTTFLGLLDDQMMARGPATRCSYTPKASSRSL